MLVSFILIELFKKLILEGVIASLAILDVVILLSKILHVVIALLQMLLVPTDKLANFADVTDEPANLQVVTVSSAILDVMIASSAILAVITASSAISVLSTVPALIDILPAFVTHILPVGVTLVNSVPFDIKRLVSFVLIVLFKKLILEGVIASFLTVLVITASLPTALFNLSDVTAQSLIVFVATA